MKEKSLGELRTFNFPKDYSFTLDALQQELSAAFEANGMEVTFSRDVVKTEGLFKDNPECLVVSVKGHESDYFNFVYYVEEAKKYNLLYVKIGGKSKQAKYDVFAKDVKVLDGGIRRGLGTAIRMGGSEGAGFAIGTIIGGTLSAGVKGISKGVNALFRDKEAYQVELDTYHLLIAVSDSVLAAN